MPGISPVLGLPGLRTAKTATHRLVFREGSLQADWALGKIIDGSQSRDPLNTGDIDVLRAGVLMGKITASGLYAPSIIGLTTVAYADNELELTVSAATATEIVRRVGSSGTLKVTGPATAGTTVSTATCTYSAVNTTTGVLTVADMNDDFVVGSLVTDDDGSETPLTVIPDGYGIKVTDDAGASIDVPFPVFPIAGVLLTANIVNWPADTALRTYLRGLLSTTAAGKFVFDDQF